jgi:hypothetical protein
MIPKERVVDKIEPGLREHILSASGRIEKWLSIREARTLIPPGASRAQGLLWRSAPGKMMQLVQCTVPTLVNLSPQKVRVCGVDKTPDDTFTPMHVVCWRSRWAAPSASLSRISGSRISGHSVIECPRPRPPHPSQGIGVLQQTMSIRQKKAFCRRDRRICNSEGAALDRQ